MGPTNIVAHELESYGARTFSAKEMAFNILGLMHPLLFSIPQVETIWADAWIVFQTSPTLPPAFKQESLTSPRHSQRQLSRL